MKNQIRLLVVAALLISLFGFVFTDAGLAKTVQQATNTPTPTPDMWWFTKTISGTVRDAGGAPIAGATVTCSQGGYRSSPTPCAGTRTTAADGTYSFGQVLVHDTDTITVRASATGYISQTISRSGFQVYSSGTFNFNLSVTGSTPTPTPTPDCATATYTLSGYVYDATNGMVIANASVYTVTTIGAAPNTTTNAEGRYILVIDNPYHGCNIIGLTSWATGYQQTSIQVTWQELKAQPFRDFYLTPGGTPTFTPTATFTSTVTVTPTSTRTPTRTTTGPTPTRTRTRTPTRTPTGGTPLPTNTPTRTNTGVPPTSTPTPTPTPTGSGACSPVTSTITAPFTFDGSGAFCWQSNNLGMYVNSWNTTNVTLNGVNITNIYVPASSYPPQQGGYWYVGYNSTVAWGHFEAK